MVDRFEENLGKYPFVDLAQVKDYLSISSNTQDARLANVINYATGMVEHYIGQEVLANDYVEVFDGGKSSVMVSRLPLSNVYQVTEYNGVEDNILDDPSTIGRPNPSGGDEMSIVFKNDAHLNTRVKNFGTSSLEIGLNDFTVSGNMPEQLEFEEGDFTVEFFMRSDSASLPTNTLIKFNTDASNYMEFGLDSANGMFFESNIAASATRLVGPNTTLATANYAARYFAHLAYTYHSQSQRFYLHYNGNTHNNVSYTVSNHTFTANVEIGGNFAGYIDEVRISSKARYAEDFTPPTKRFRPDNETVTLIHFDGKNKAKEAKDVHNAINEYSFTRDMGEVTRDVGGVGVRGTYPTLRNSYPAMTLSGPPSFQPYPSGVKVEYRAGYESGEVPQDIQMATLDVIKLIYKQDQEKKGFSFEGERGDKYPLAGNFPPHIRRILDLYRIVT